MIKGLIKAAADLDSAGFHVEADVMDKIMQRVAQSADFGFLPSKGEKKTETDDSAEDEYEEEESDEEEESEEEESEEEESEEEGDAISMKECLEHCMMLSTDEKCALMKALLDSICE